MNLTCLRTKVFLSIALVAILFITSQCTSEQGKVTSKDVKGAQNLIGIEFSNQEIDTLVSYLEENKEGCRCSTRCSDSSRFWLFMQAGYHHRY